MANTLYPKARSAFARGDLDWESGTWRVYCLSSAYTYDAAHDYVSDLAGLLGSPTAITGRTVIDPGICDATDTSYPGVTLGQTVERIVIASWSGSDATSPVVAYMDTRDDTTPLSRAGNGAPILIQWSESASKVFQL